MPLAQVLPHPQLIFPSKTWFFGTYLNFQWQKSVRNQHLPHFESKSYQINSIKSCSSRSFQQHQRHIPIPLKFSAMINMIAKWPCKKKRFCCCCHHHVAVCEIKILKTIDFLQLWYHLMSFMSWHEYARHNCCKGKKKKLKFKILKIMTSCDIIHIMMWMLKWRRENKWILFF